VLPELDWPPSILGLEQEGLHLVSGVSLDAEKPIDPVQNNVERLGFAHVLLSLDKSVKLPLDWPPKYGAMDLPCELGQSIFEHHVHVLNWVDLVIIPLFQSGSFSQVTECR
jgi:hypothetical protein